MNNNAKLVGYLVAGLLTLSGVPVIAMAQPLDDVGLEFQEQGVVATIRLTGPIRYQRHFPESHGKTLEIFYERVKGATSDEKWVDNEVRKSPPSGLIPSFTVTTRDQQTQPKLVIEFSREAEYSVAPGKDNRSLQITIIPTKRAVRVGALPFLPVIKPAPAPVPAASMTPDEADRADINSQARALMVQGRDALASKNNEAAVDAFNKLLLLPPNDYTQDAQEWVGVARERALQIDKAKIEYELYLRLYPEGDDAARVAQRLEGLSGKAGAGGVAIDQGERKQAARWMTFGSASTRYYYGSSKIDSTYTFNNAQTTTSQTVNDQSMLITSLDANERYVSDEYDGRLVLRDVGTTNFLSNQPSQNRLNAAYGEIKNRKQDYMVRVGRQSAMGGGVLGRFDGLAASYGNVEGTQFNGVAGTLSEYSQGTQPTFYGASVDMGSLSMYAIKQRIGSTTDRRAVGLEYRYFEGDKTAFAMIDYDTSFKEVNATQLMGTMGAFGGTLNFMLDSRKTPSLSIRNALSGAATSDIEALLQTMTTSSLRDLARSRTATATLGQVGITVPVREKWQAGGDIRVSNTTDLPASGTTALEGILPANPGRGAEKSLTLHVIGSNLYTEGDIWSGSVTTNSGNAVKGNSIYLYNHTLFENGWAMDTTLQIYSQTDQYGGTTKRTSPMVRGAYRLREQLYFDVDFGIELNDYTGELQSNKTTRYYSSAGVRWDF